MARKSASSGNPSSEMTFFDHLDALRPHLVRSALAIIVLAVTAFLLKNFIVDGILLGPQSPDFPTNRLLNSLGEKWGIEGLRVSDYSFDLINTAVAGQFNLHLKISFVAAFVSAVPYLMWELWRFVKPALTPSEKKATNLFVFWVSLCFFTGLLFGYFVISPLAINFLLNYTASAQISNMIDISSYLSTVMGTSVACGLVFQLPLLVWFLARMGIVTPGFMKKYRRHAIVVIAIFSAIITPPDLMSMVLVWIPFYGLYELSIGIATRVAARRQDS